MFKDKIELFYLNRKEDVSGMSGTGRVALGVKMPNGQVVIYWNSNHNSIGIFHNIDEFILIHGHEGKGEIVWGSPDYDEKPKKQRKKKTEEQK